MTCEDDVNTMHRCNGSSQFYCIVIQQDDKTSDKIELYTSLQIHATIKTFVQRKITLLIALFDITIGLAHVQTQLKIS